VPSDARVERADAFTGAIDEVPQQDRRHMCVEPSVTGGGSHGTGSGSHRTNVRPAAPSASVNIVSLGA